MPKITTDPEKVRIMKTTRCSAWLVLTGLGLSLLSGCQTWVPEAGITVRETRDLWDMPALFLGFLLLAASQWLLRRKWGVI